MPRIQLGGVAADPDALAAGDSTIPRWSVGALSSLGSGVMRLTYFTATRTEPVNFFRLGTGSVAASATPTLCRVGLYSVEANGDLALVSSIANDTTLFSTTNASYVRAAQAAHAKIAGQRYALGILVVSAAGMPNLPCSGTLGAVAADSAMAPRTAGASVPGLTDLPASLAGGAVAVSSMHFYAAVTP